MPLLSRVFFANFLYKYLYLFRDSIRMVIVFFVFLIANVSIAKRPLTSARFSASVIRSFQILQGLRLLFCSHFCAYSTTFCTPAWGIGGRWPSILLRASHTCEFVAKLKIKMYFFRVSIRLFLSFIRKVDRRF